MGRHKNIACYALYKGDDFIDVGTIRDLSKRQGYTEKTLYWLASSTQHKERVARHPDKCLDLFRLDEEE